MRGQLLDESMEIMTPPKLTFWGRTNKTMKEFFHKLFLTLRMIKVQHSIFALPFALASFWVASQGNPDPKIFVFIIIAMVTARNAAMSFNRIVDRNFDKINPRTQNREIPSGKLSLKFSIFFCTINSILFIITSYYFNWLTFILSPIALMIILGYSFTKRFTHCTQFFLGLSLGIAPVAAWIATTGTVSPFSIFLGLAVLFWVSGFDVIYSTLDYDFDRKNGLKNMVVKLGINKSVLASRVLHIISIVFIILAGLIANFHSLYFIGTAIVAALLFYEHSLVKPGDFSKVNVAFFTMNGYVALVYFIFVLCDLYFFAPGNLTT